MMHPAAQTLNPDPFTPTPRSEGGAGDNRAMTLPTRDALRLEWTRQALADPPARAVHRILFKP